MGGTTSMEGGYSLGLEVWHGEEHLHDRVEVAAVAQVLHAGQPGAGQRPQGGARLLDHLPFTYPLVHRDLQLRHGVLRLGGAAGRVGGAFECR